EFGLSPRGGLALLKAAKAYALVEGEKFVLPEHVQAILPAVVNHRLPENPEPGSKQTTSPAQYILESTRIS
ncbi:MAG: AAA family ATPase, partial [Gammaproteobacteria bacterium]|nr:AAA family ATPase [Gammaproteobacteria bacterium]